MSKRKRSSFMGGLNRSALRRAYSAFLAGGSVVADEHKAQAEQVKDRIVSTKAYADERQKMPHNRRRKLSKSARHRLKQ